MKMIPFGLSWASVVCMIPMAVALTSRDVRTHAGRGDHDLVFMHVPYNFGHTIELTRLLRPWQLDTAFNEKGSHGGNVNAQITSMVTKSRISAMQFIKPDSDAWGHYNPDLLTTSDVSGCGLYFTPQKYWPKDMAAKYFGTKTVFGMLRDPYERLVAFFRGGFDDYGGNFPEFFKTCDVNGALKQMMKQVLSSKDAFMNNCTFLPQAEYFDGPYGITLPIDNRLFPSSMNEAFKAHGYTEHIKTKNIGHVSGCNNVWAGDLDAETKQMIRQYYARDFELLCKHFGYCDSEENVCLQQVEYMCPTKLFQWDNNQMQYVRSA